MKDKWYKGKVRKGDGSGAKIGFPTANLSPSIVPSDLKEGVYACLVSVGSVSEFSNSPIQKKIYKGALFYGPRMVKGETHKQLEIYIIDFAPSTEFIPNRVEGLRASYDLYGEEIEFKIGKYIREVRDFGEMGELREQMEEDVETVKNALDKD